MTPKEQQAFDAMREAIRNRFDGNQETGVRFDKALRMADAAAKEVREPVAWQPIETAPKDGTSILIYCPHNERKPVCEAWWAIAYEGDTGGHWQTPVGPNGRGYTILPTSPTHWMPLPPTAGAALYAHPAPAQQDHSVDANKMVAVVNQQLTTDAKLLEACKAFSDYVQAEQCSTDGAVTYSTSTINHHAFSIRAAIAQAEGEKNAV